MYFGPRKISDKKQQDAQVVFYDGAQSMITNGFEFVECLSGKKFSPYLNMM